MPFRARNHMALSLAGAIAGAAVAGPGAPVYATDFQQGAVGPEWNGGTLTTSTAFTRFMGRFGNRSIALSMGVDGSRLHTLSFDFYAIDSWDGSSTPWGPDWFGVRLNGDDIFRETFSNWAGGPQTYEGVAQISGTNLDFNWHNDSVWSLSFDFLPVSNNLTLEFYAQGLEPMANESWGIDNIVVRQAEEIPAPGAAALLGVAGAAGLRRRRR